MKKFKLTKSDVVNLADCMDKVPTESLGIHKNIRLLDNIHKDLLAANKEFSDEIARVTDVRTAIMTKHLEAYKKLPEEGRKAKEKELAEARNKEVSETLDAQYKKLDEQSLEEVEVKLSEEKFLYLKELFVKHGPKAYPGANGRRTYLDIVEALRIEE